MMKKKLLLLLFAPLLFAGGCDKYLDVNHSPDALEAIPSPDVLLPTAQLNLGAVMGWHMGIISAMYVQYWTASYIHAQFRALCEYQNTSYDFAWTNLYTGALINLKQIREVAEANPQDAASGAYLFIAEALSIFAWQTATDTWGDIPYTEALQGGALLHPKFDKQEEIYTNPQTGLLARIDALLQTDVSKLSIANAKFDLLFGGDMKKWYAFANTLKVKLMLRLSETSKFDLDGLKAHLDQGIEDGTLLLAEGARLPASLWDDALEGKRHPLREAEAGGAQYISRAVIGCKTLTDYLAGRDATGAQNVTAATYRDPRLAKIFVGTSGSSGTPHRGAYFGDSESQEDSDENGIPDDRQTNAADGGSPNYWANPVFIGTAAQIAPYMDLFLISPWEVNFYAAEIFARKSEFTEAKKYYDAAVSANLKQHGLAAADEAKVTGASGYAKFTANKTEDAIKQIGMQKWAAYVNYQHHEAFLERSRLKIPAVAMTNGVPLKVEDNRKGYWKTLPLGDLTVSSMGYAIAVTFEDWIASSPIYPTAVLSRNNNADPQKKDMGRKVWWNQKKDTDK